VNNPDQGGQAAGRPRGDCPLTPQWPNHAPGVLVGCTCPGGYNLPADEPDEASECAICAPGQCPGPEKCPGWLGLPPEAGHDCPKQEFLDDPITRYYGVGAEMVALVSCPVCDAEEANR
jgi:hypothetical protein